MLPWKLQLWAWLVSRALFIHPNSWECITKHGADYNFCLLPTLLYMFSWWIVHVYGT